MIAKTVYIPIWLDLLYLQEKQEKQKIDCLHSNMVRFIMYFETIDRFN